MNERRVIVMVLDGCGAGAAPDHAKFGDGPEVATVKNVWDNVGGFVAPTLESVGFLAACRIGDAPENAVFGRLQELSMGKDSVTGHWEMMGIVTEVPFPTYPAGFPEDLVTEFCRKAGIERVLGNCPASGTAIISKLGQEHLDTGFPILYTSADSVFQVAAHEDVIPIERLYEICRVAREVCVAPHNVQRVIARPFIGEVNGFERTTRRKDFPLTAPPNLVDEMDGVFGIGVIPELFDGRGFLPVERTQSNPEHWAMLERAMDSESRYIFVNFEDFDMLYGHRSDPEGFANCLVEFDDRLSEFLKRLGPDDLLVLTADHGNDPTDKSSDHTREFVPLSVFNSGLKGQSLGDLVGMYEIGAIVTNWLGIESKIVHKSRIALI